MPRRQQCASNGKTFISPVPYDFSMVPNCVASDEGLQASVLEEIVTRAEWTSSVAELVGLSHEAAGRRARKTGSFRGIHHNNAEAERLSFSFIAERTQTDDPIEGYMIRTKDRARQLQGFLWFTNFTTWTHFFRWDSLASKAELHGRAQRDGISWDADGSLSSELELQHRDGDPNDQGVIWPRVAEIALVGGLECGGFLVQLALEALERSMSYDFVVVQATESSAGFYDRMGFRRVGALAKYITSDVAPHQARTVAYRHWAYPDEDVSKMDSSIMMAIKLRAGQVVQRIMAGEGGIFPNRHRFMDRQPARGVLSLPRPCAHLVESSKKEASAPATDTSAASVPSTPGGSIPCADSPAGTEGAKEVARRSQACRPWVCYGNPSATCLSPKRRREGASNQLHRSGGSVSIRSDRSPSLTHIPVSGAPQRTPAHTRAAELQPYPRAPRGVFRPSKRKSPCGDPCLTVDREPAGTAPESDLFPALGLAAPPPTQRPRRDRSGYGERRYAGYPPPPPPPVRNRPVAVAVRSYPPAEIPDTDVPAVNGPMLAEKSCGIDKTETLETPTVVATTDAPAASELAETLAVAEAAADADAVDVSAAPVINMEDSAETAAIDGMESAMGCSKAPIRAVAIRRYPLPVQQRVEAHGPANAPDSEDAGTSVRKAALASVTRRLHRSKPRLALRARYAREAAARARATQRRSGISEAAFGVSSGERLDLGPLPVCARPKLERAVPDLLSAAGVVSTRGPFDCDEEAALPALTVPAKARSGSGADAMALPMLEGVDVFERCTCFELMIAGEDRPCCDFCANCAKRKDVDCNGERNSHDDRSCPLKEEAGVMTDREGTENEDDADEEEEEVGVAREKQPRQRVPVSKFRFQQLRLRVYPRKSGHSHAAKHASRTDQKAISKRPTPGVANQSWRKRGHKGKMPSGGACSKSKSAAVANTLSSPVVTKESESESESELDEKEEIDAGELLDGKSEEKMDGSMFGECESITFPPYPWATEDDGSTVAGQIWRPMQCPFALVDGVVYATRGYEAVAPLQGKRPLVVSLSTPSKPAAECEGRELESGSASEVEDVMCNGCRRTDREEEMVLCDDCDAGWHLDCLSPPLSAVPVGDWLCPGCCATRKGIDCRQVTECREKSSLSETIGASDSDKRKADLIKAVTDGQGNQQAFHERMKVRVVPLRHRQPVVRFKFPRQTCVTQSRNDLLSSSAAATSPAENALSPDRAAEQGPATPSEAHSKTSPPATHSSSFVISPGTSSKQHPHCTPPSTLKLAHTSHRKKVVSTGEVEILSKVAPRNDDMQSTGQPSKVNSAGETRSLSSRSSKGRESLNGQGGSCGPRQGTANAGQAMKNVGRATAGQAMKNVGTATTGQAMKKLGAATVGQAIKHVSKVEEIQADKRIKVPNPDRASPRQPTSQPHVAATDPAAPACKAASAVQGSSVMSNGSRSEVDTGLWSKIRSESLRRICEDVRAAVSGNRVSLISRILSRLVGREGQAELVPSSEDLSRLRMSTLRRVCGDLAISMSGNKEALIWRLVAVFAADGQSALELSDNSSDISRGNVRPQVMRSCGAAVLPDTSHIWQEWPCDGCGRADREEEMVLCDSCDAGWHLDCLSPALPAVPDGDWLCPECAVGHRASGSQSEASAQAAPGNRVRSEGSRKRVRYAMLRTSTARNLDRFELSSGRSSRGVVSAKRQRLPVARFRFSGIEAAPV